MDSIARMMEKTGAEDDVPIQAGMVSKAIESAQRQVESMHFAARKNVLEYDDVMNLQRNAIYNERNAILDGKDLSSRIGDIVSDAAYAIVDDDSSVVADALIEYLEGVYDEKKEAVGDENMRKLEAQVMLRIIDVRWMNHLQEMDYLKTGIGLRAFGQRDPLVEYKEEAHAAFASLTASMYEDFLRTLLRLQVAAPVEDEQSPLENRKMSYSSPEAALESTMRAPARQGASQQPKPAPAKPQTYRKEEHDPYANVGRNDPCPCGSGLKFKKCHGRDR